MPNKRINVIGVELHSALRDLLSKKTFKKVGKIIYKLALAFKRVFLLKELQNLTYKHIRKKIRDGKVESQEIKSSLMEMTPSSRE